MRLQGKTRGTSRVVAATRVALGAVICAGITSPGLAEPPVPDLADLTLEQLGNVVVTSVSRREERLIEAPASIFVINGDDIRRSARVSGILKDAEDRAKDQLRLLLIQLGFEQVDFRIE